MKDFLLKQEIVNLFRTFADIENGPIPLIEIRHDFAVPS